MSRRRIASPLRDALDKRVHWTLSLIDDRLGRRGATVHERLDDLERFTRATLQAQGWLAAGDRPGGALLDLDAGRAAYLNWAGGPDGYAAQAGLWFNPPVPVELAEGAADVLLVNERIVEQPWIFSLLPCDRSLRIADVGGSESTVALSLATLGHAVEVIDPRGYPVEHPNLTVHPCRLDEYAGPGGWDAVVCLSAVEHFGLEHYGQDGSDSREDLAALQHLRAHIAAQGRLLLTVPHGPESVVAGFERVYDHGALDELLRGWQVRSRTVVQRASRTAWERLAPDEHPQARAVAMIEATPQL